MRFFVRFCRAIGCIRLFAFRRVEAAGQPGDEVPPIPPESMKISRHYALLLLSLAAFFGGCATSRPKPWEYHKTPWWQREMDPDDRAFYQETLFGGYGR
jgi:hypothetical protein